MEAADVVIMNDDLQRVAETVRLSKRTHAILWQNITLALGIKSVFLVMAVVRHGHHVDGGLRGHGSELAGGRQWTALATWDQIRAFGEAGLATQSCPRP
jgi:hypothetical protein